MGLMLDFIPQLGAPLPAAPAPVKNKVLGPDYMTTLTPAPLSPKPASTSEMDSKFVLLGAALVAFGVGALFFHRTGSRGFLANDKYSPLHGGLAEGLNPKDFDPYWLKVGIEVELEHTNDRGVAQRIAMDHLKEDPHYYAKLQGMESPLGSIFAPNPTTFKEYTLHEHAAPGRNSWTIEAYFGNWRKGGEAEFIGVYDYARGGKLVGLKGWNVEVRPEHRRKGLARAMYRYAEKVWGLPVYPGDFQTPEGAAFLGLKANPSMSDQEFRDRIEEEVVAMLGEEDANRALIRFESIWYSGNASTTTPKQVAEEVVAAYRGKPLSANPGIGSKRDVLERATISMQLYLYKNGSRESAKKNVEAVARMWGMTDEEAWRYVDKRARGVRGYRSNPRKLPAGEHVNVSADRYEQGRASVRRAEARFETRVAQLMKEHRWTREEAEYEAAQEWQEHISPVPLGIGGY